MTEADILYQRGDYWARKVAKGFEVYRDGLTHAVRMSVIGYTGAKGLERAKADVDNRFTFEQEIARKKSIAVRVEANE